ncbi:restriction endonuclease subunit S [Holdemania filiformis]|uniref:restriction endonuclease subunit S n=1 Tax=Holdemania filiformis TaxID=61171 RepID=UPI00210CB63A|nr:restriction endonuclease subunit S [Holdemania filiformis]
MFNKFKLGDICEIVSGTTPNTSCSKYWNGDINWITPAELSDDTIIINESVRKITRQAVIDTGLKSFPPGTVILSSRAPIGKVAIAGREMYCNQGFKNLICSERINNIYLYWFLKRNTQYLNSLGRGATFKEISKSIVSDIQISLPLIEEQIKRAENLRKCWNVIILRKRELCKLDDLIKARFVEMFGDIKSNSKKWEQVYLKDISYLISGGTPSRAKPEYFEGEIPWISTVALGKTEIGFEDAIEYITKDAIENSATKLIPANSLLFGIRVGVGKVSKNVVPMCTNQDIVSITNIDDNFNLVFLKYLLDEYLDFFNGQKRGATIQGIKSETLKNILVPKVNLKLQNDFEQFVNQVDKSKYVAPYK